MNTATSPTIDHATIWNAFLRMRNALASEIGRELSRETGLSEADFDVLSVLAEHPQESVRAMALRCGLDWEKSRLSHQLKRMEQRGLVAREVCVEDNRGSMIAITPLGRERVTVARELYARILQERVFGVLTAEQIRQFGEITGAIADGFPTMHQERAETA